jgi:hypothetical protein
VGGLALFYRPNPFPAGIRANAVTPLYYPAHLPAGFKLNPDSFAQKHGVTLYNFDAPDGNKLHITIEKTTPKLDLNHLNSDTMTETQTIATPSGTAHIGNLGDNTMANLVIDGTWVMAVYSQPKATDDLAAIMKSLRRF